MSNNIKKTFALCLLLALTSVMTVSAQSSKTGNNVSALSLYQAFRSNKTNPYEGKVVNISGVATDVGPDPYALPSVELAEAKDKSSRVLCVLPFTDYLKLRKVLKGDKVVIQGEARGFSKEHGYVVVKECKILYINGKKQ